MRGCIARCAAESGPTEADLRETMPKRWQKSYFRITARPTWTAAKRKGSAGETFTGHPLRKHGETSEHEGPGEKSPGLFRVRIQAIGMKDRVRIWDNDGETCDRYTAVYITQPVEGKSGQFYAVGMSENPYHPQGFGQHCECEPGDHLGTEIEFDQLPEPCQRLIRRDLAALES